MNYVMNPFVHLHVHTQYSLLDGACRIGDLVAAAAAQEIKAVAMTDHGVMSGAVDFFKKCKDQKVKPLIGCETYVAKESRLEFLSPGRGELSVRFALEPGVRARIAAELDSGGRCLVELASVVTDCQGTEVARLDATYHIRRRAAEGPAPRGSTSGSGNG